MAKKAESDAEFIGLLRESRESGTNKPPGMVLNKPPVGRGKSLDELLDGGEASPSSAMGGIARVGLDRLTDSPFQPRLRYDPAYIEDLAGSLREVGQKEVITVRPSGDGFEIINGHCRARAAALAGWTALDARVVTADDREAEVSALVQNETRKDLTDYERARLYRRAIEAGLAKNQAAVARMFGCSEGRVSQALSMLGLPESIRRLLDQRPDLFGYRTARDLLELTERHPDEEELMLQAVSRLVEGAKASSIKPWVQQILARRKGRPVKAGGVRIVDDTGRLVFRSKVNMRQVVVDVLPGMDTETVHDWIVEALRKHAVPVKE